MCDMVFFSSKLKKIQLNLDLSKYQSHKTTLNAANQISTCFLAEEESSHSYIFLCVPRGYFANSESHSSLETTVKND